MRSSLITQVLRSPAFWVLSTASLVAFVANWDQSIGNSSATYAREGGSPSRSDSVSSTKENSKENILREGTILTDIRGKFRVQGERIVFTEEGSNRTMKCLENLWLHRIMASQKNEDRKVTWLISAKITEFETENFLSVETASKMR